MIARTSAVPIVNLKEAEPLLKNVISVVLFASLRSGLVILYADLMMLVVALCARVNAPRESHRHLFLGWVDQCSVMQAWSAYRFEHISLRDFVEFAVLN